jgi:hypothetical protein
VSELLYTEQKFWNRQKKAREADQNFMKLSPNDVELLLNTILAERTRADLLTARIDELIPQCARVTAEMIQTTMEIDMPTYPQGDNFFDPNKSEPKPVHNGNTPIWELVINDMKARDEMGTKKYGSPPQGFNGRNALVDAYQEVLDLAVYLRQRIYEDQSKTMAMENLLAAMVSHIVRMTPSTTAAYPNDVSFNTYEWVRQVNELLSTT